MGLEKVLLAEAELRIARRRWDNTVEGAGRILRAQMQLKTARASHRDDELAAATMISEALSEYAANMVLAGNANGVILCGVQQARGAAKFLASEAGSEDAWKFPVRIMKAGWASGSLEIAGAKETVPHYFPSAVVAEVARATNGARFRRKHPETGNGSEDAELTAGWMTDGRIEGDAAFASVNLLKSESGIRSTLLAARDAGKLDLFSVSISGYFGFKREQVDGKPALVATGLGKLMGVDWCAEAGAGGRFLPVAAG